MANEIVKNRVEIIGTLKEYNLEIKNSKTNGSEFISGDIKVDAILDDKLNEFTIQFFAKKLTQNGAESKLFESYDKMRDLVGKKVRVSGELREERYFNKTTNQMASAQRISGKFVSAEKGVTPDKARFEFGGFVRKGLVAKTNKDNEIYTYDLEVAQSNYNGTNMNVFHFNVDPAKPEIIKAITSMYPVNATVSFEGDIRSIVQIATVEEKAAFGDARVKTYTNLVRSYNITSGDNPIVGEGMYDMTAIMTLTQAYAARDIQITAENATAAAAAAPARPVTSRQTSLI